MVLLFFVLFRFFVSVSSLRQTPVNHVDYCNKVLNLGSIDEIVPMKSLCFRFLKNKEKDFFFFKSLSAWLVCEISFVFS